MPQITEAICNVCGARYTGENALEKALECEQRPIQEQKFKEGDIVAGVLRNGIIKLLNITSDIIMIGGTHSWLYDGFEFDEDNVFKLNIYPENGERIVKKSDNYHEMSQLILKNIFHNMYKEIAEHSYYNVKVEE